MRKMRLRLYVLALALLAGIALFCYLFAGRILVTVYARANNLDISYLRLTGFSIRQMTFDRLKVSDKTTGIGIDSAHAKIRPLWRAFSRDGIAMDFNLSEVSFTKREAEKPKAYDDIDGLIAVPFQGHWRYSEISGRMQPVKDGFGIKDLSARSDEIRLLLNGTVSGPYLDLDIVIYFAGALTKKVPEPLSNTVLTEEPDGWKSLSVKLKGDYKTPSMQISSKLFRLNINTISSPDKQ